MFRVRHIFGYIPSVGLAAIASWLLMGAVIPSMAASMLLDRRPLAIVRFSAQEVQYGPLVDKAVKAALQVKRDTIFTLAGLSNPADAKQAAYVRSKVIEMADHLQSVGVSPDRILAVFDTDKEVAVSEMRIYVE